MTHDRAYYDEIIRKVGGEFGVSHNPERAIIIVTQGLPDATNYLEAYKQLGNVCAIIPKGSKVLHPELIDEWKQNGLPIRDDITRDDLKDPNAALKFIKESIGDAKEFMIVDHGGYFVPAMQHMQEDDALKDRCIGIIDGSASARTQQGYDSIQYPYLSHENSIGKDRECHFIAHDTVAAIKVILDHITENGLNDIKTVGIIGLGTTGNPMIGAFKYAAELLDTDIHIIGAETNPAVIQNTTSWGSLNKWKPHTLLDYKKLFYDETYSQEMKKLLSKSDVIVSCTGANPLKDEDFKNIKNGAFLATITSADDELDLESRIASGVLTRAADNKQLSQECAEGTDVPLNVTYKTSSRKTVNLILDGRPPNYLLKEQNPNIAMSHGIKLISALRLLSGKDIKPGYQTLDEEDAMKCLEPWLYKHGFKADFTDKIAKERAANTGSPDLP